MKHQHHWALSSIPKVPCKLCESVLGCLSERILIDVRMDPALRREPVLDSAGTAAACFQPRCGLRVEGLRFEVWGLRFRVQD